jgi:GcrA cell cycle regulator
MVWTEETVEELKKMWDKGMTTGQIAKALNVTKNSIIGKVHRLCLTARPSPIKKSSIPKTETEDKKTASKTKKACKTSEKKEKTSEKKVEKTIKEKVVEPKEVKVVEPAPKVVEETNIPLVKLDNHTCRWPLGDPKDDDFCFCGKRIKTGQTYCEEHAAVAYVRNGKKA